MCFKWRILPLSQIHHLKITRFLDDGMKQKWLLIAAKKCGNLLPPKSETCGELIPDGYIRVYHDSLKRHSSKFQRGWWNISCGKTLCVLIFFPIKIFQWRKKHTMKWERYGWCVSLEMGSYFWSPWNPSKFGLFPPCDIIVFSQDGAVFHHHVELKGIPLQGTI